MFFTFGLKEYGCNNEVVLSRGGRKAGFHCRTKSMDMLHYEKFLLNFKYANC